MSLSRMSSVRRVQCPLTSQLRAALNTTALRRPRGLLAPLSLFTHAEPATFQRRRCANHTSSRHSPEQKADAAAGDGVSSQLKDSSTPLPRAVEAAQLAEMVAGVKEARTRLVQNFASLPLDRRVLYRDHLLTELLANQQQELRVIFARLYEYANGVAVGDGDEVSMSSETLSRMKATWLKLRAAPPSSAPEKELPKHAHFDEIRTFYSGLLCSGLVRSDATIRLILSELQRTDLLEPDAAFYESVFISLWGVQEAQREPVPDAPRDSTTSSQNPAALNPSADTTAGAELITGEARQLRRGVVGDLASHYMGYALAQETAAAAALQHRPVRVETWELFFCTFANAQPAPKLMDLWWARFLEWVDTTEERSAAASPLSMDSAPHTGAAAAAASDCRSPLPYQAVHAVLAWCAQSRDMERALKYFNAVNQRGVSLHRDTTTHDALSQPTSDAFTRPGSLTAPSSLPAVQAMQLAMLVKLMASTKSVKRDGGLRALVVRDVQRQIDPAVLYAAPWGVLNDLLSGLSVPSAMQLLRRCSLAPAPAAATSRGGCEGEPRGPRGRDIPFFIWASLLRRCGREHLQDQAESLFAFLRHKFPLTSPEKRELVEIMMRMYVTMQPADFPSALDVFLQHVLRTPPNEPPVKADEVLYELLIKGADSRNAAMMLFLEACASGVALTAELFEALMGSTEFKTVASLSRKLPHDYAASSLDAQLKIPADADAHLRREEALRARGKPLYDSTGDAG